MNKKSTITRTDCRELSKKYTYAAGMSFVKYYIWDEFLANSNQIQLAPIVSFTDNDPHFCLVEMASSDWPTTVNDTITKSYSTILYVVSFCTAQKIYRCLF